MSEVSLYSVDPRERAVALLNLALVQGSGLTVWISGCMDEG